MDQAFTNPNFQKWPAPTKEFTLSEQLGYARQLYGIKADLVPRRSSQFCISKKSITTINGLTVLVGQIHQKPAGLPC